MSTDAERIAALEARVAALEEKLSAVGIRLSVAERSAAEPVTGEDGEPASFFDLSLTGRTLIILGGAYLLRAITEAHLVPVALGILLGLAYAVSWSIASMRGSVSRPSAAYHGIATTITSLPLIFEATRRFHVFNDWTAALALLVVGVVMYLLVSRRQLEGIAWTFALMVLAVAPLLMFETKSIVPFTLYLVVVGVATLWLGYLYEWTLLRWIVAAELDLVLAVFTVLVVTRRLPEMSPAVAIAVQCIAFAAYLACFALRTLWREREVIAFEIAQMLALLGVALGGSMWIAANTATLEVPIAVAMLALAGASYAVSFAFIPKHFDTPANFVFYSSLGLMLIVGGGAFVSRGLAGSVLWSALALASAFFAVRFQKSSLALHAAVLLMSGIVGAGIVPFALGIPTHAWLILFAATAISAATRPIERKGSFELWTIAKAAVLAELGWIAASLLNAVIEPRLGGDAAVISVERTAVFAGLTVLTAFAARFTTLSPGRYLCNPLMWMLALKLVWEDFRVGRPSTLFVSLAIVGVALILTPRLRRAAHAPVPRGVLVPAM